VINGAAAAMGSPIPVAAIARKTYKWVTEPDGSTPGPDSPAGGAGIHTDHIDDIDHADHAPASGHRRTDRVCTARLQEFHAELNSRTRDTIDQLQKKLTDEAHTMSGALAAATDAFFHRMVRTNDVEWQYEALCGPHRREIWPSEFDGGSARLAADISALQKQAHDLIAAVGTLREQRSTLSRLP
jgi:hypothetical protein